MSREMRNIYMAEQSERKRPLERYRRTLVVNIKIHLKESFILWFGFRWLRIRFTGNTV